MIAGAGRFEGSKCLAIALQAMRDSDLLCISTQLIQQIATVTGSIRDRCGILAKGYDATH